MRFSENAESIIKSKSKRSEKMKVVHELVEGYSAKIAEVAFERRDRRSKQLASFNGHGRNHKRSQKGQRLQEFSLQGMTLVVPTPPCHDCKPVVRACGFRTVITNPNGGKHFSRKSELTLTSMGKRTQVFPVRGLLMEATA